MWYDQTDKQLYIERGYSNSFVCTDFAERLHNNAEAYGIKSAYVTIKDTTEVGHALNAFNTIDRGWVYIDSTGSEKTSCGSCSRDKVASLRIGEVYSLEFLFSCFWCKPGAEQEIVTDIDVYW